MPKAEASTFVLSVHTHKADGTPAQEPFLHLARVSAAGNVLGGAYLGPRTVANCKALYESLDSIRTELASIARSIVVAPAPAAAPVDPQYAEFLAWKAAQAAPAPVAPAPAAPVAKPKATRAPAAPAPAKSAEAELEDLPWA